MNDWTDSGDTKVIEASGLARSVFTPEGRAYGCPCCGLPILQKHITGVDRNGDDIAGTRFRHSCGQKLLIIND